MTLEHGRSSGHASLPMPEPGLVQPARHEESTIANSRGPAETTGQGPKVLQGVPSREGVKATPEGD